MATRTDARRLSRAQRPAGAERGPGVPFRRSPGSRSSIAPGGRRRGGREGRRAYCRPRHRRCGDRLRASCRSGPRRTASSAAQRELAPHVTRHVVGVVRHDHDRRAPPAPRRRVARAGARAPRSSRSSNGSSSRYSRRRRTNARAASTSRNCPYESSRAFRSAKLTATPTVTVPVTRDALPLA